MATTVVGKGDSIAVKLYSVSLFKYSLGESFWLSKMAGKDFVKKDRPGKILGTSPEYPLQIIRDLTTSAGDRVSVDVFTDIRGDGVYGDDILEGKEKDLTWYTDEVFIEQIRQAVSAGGRMSRKRTKHDLRMVARDMLKRWFARYFDESITVYLCGRRGKNTSQWVLDTAWSGFAGNSLQPADAEHSFALDATGNYTPNPANATTFSLKWLDKLDTYISKMDVPPNPIVINGEEYYVVVLNPDAVEQLRTDTSVGSWLDIQKNAGVRGAENPIFKNSLGSYGRFILYSYSKLPIFTAGTQQVANNLVLGAQAAIVAFGNAGGNFNLRWEEEVRDYGNLLSVSAGIIWGVKKTRFNGKDFGVLSLYSKVA